MSNNENGNFGNSLMIPEKENIFKKFFKWISNVFNGKNKIEYIEVNKEIKIPKPVKMPVYQENNSEEIDENSAEYLFNLDDDELIKVEKEYDEKLEEISNEISKLENILKSYKQSIKKIQSKLGEDEI